MTDAELVREIPQPLSGADDYKPLLKLIRSEFNSRSWNSSRKYRCHVERSETSLDDFSCGKSEILRFAQNDTTIMPMLLLLFGEKDSKQQA